MNFITAMVKRGWVPYALSFERCFSSVLLDGSTLSSSPLHVWKVVANSAIDAYGYMFSWSMFVPTCIREAYLEPIGITIIQFFKGSTISIQLYTLPSFRVMSKILELAVPRV